MIPARPVLATLVVGSNWAASLNGVSRGLQSDEDRERFLALRNSAAVGAIVVGARTAEVEPYQKTPHPLFIYQRSLGVTPAQFIHHVQMQVDGSILCEGGVQFIHSLLRENVIDIFHLTRVSRAGDNHVLDIDLVRTHMALIQSEQINTSTFEKYERASR